MQIVLGARQVGKTTGVGQLIAEDPAGYYSVSADDVLTPGRAWLVEHWNRALATHRILVIDEIQKVAGWSDTIKGLWDQHRNADTAFRCVFLGSSSLLLRQGMHESLAGRYEEIQVPHWSFEESRQFTGMNLDEYLRVGGYPGAYQFRGDPDRWRKFVLHFIIDNVIGKDILQNHTVKHPALFRQVFELVSAYPAQVVSFTELLGQLQERGNTDLVKHYLSLYEGAFLLRTLQKYSGSPLRLRTSSPKLIPRCPALITCVNEKADPGFVFEAVVGEMLCQLSEKVTYWREGNAEVDFVMEHHGSLWAIEVKSGRPKPRGGLDAFLKLHPEAKPMVIDRSRFAELARDPAPFQ